LLTPLFFVTSLLTISRKNKPETSPGRCEQPPAKAGGFGLRLKAGLIGHAADPHFNSVLFLNYAAQLAFFPQPLNPSKSTQLSIDTLDYEKTYKLSAA